MLVKDLIADLEKGNRVEEMLRRKKPEVPNYFVPHIHAIPTPSGSTTSTQWDISTGAQWYSSTLANAGGASGTVYGTTGM